MFLSIIIPCRNEEKYIETCLLSVINNDYPKDQFEIIVVDGESTDNTIEIIKKIQSEYSYIRVINNPQKNVPAAMNLGIKNAKGNIIMRLDAHTYYPNNYISTLIQWKEKLNADNLGSVIETNALNKTKKSIAIVKVLSSKFGVGNSEFRIGINEPKEVDTVPFGCFDREVFDKIGMYDERLKRNQDIELNKRMKLNGMKVFLVPFVSCTYFVRETFGAMMKNNYSNGLWNILTVYYTKNFRSLSLRHFIPMFFILFLLLPLILSIININFIWVSVISFLLYVLVYVAISINMKKENTNIIYLLFSFFILHFSYGIGSFVGLFHFKKLFSN